MISPKTNTFNKNLFCTSKIKSIKFDLETDRLKIMSYKDKDFEDSTEVYSEANFDYGSPRSRDGVLLLIDKGTQHFKNGEPYGLFTIRKKDDNSFVGHIDLFPTEEPGVLEIGFIIHPKHRKSGFCSEAVYFFIHGFAKDLKLKSHMTQGIHIKEIIATAHPENSASQKVLEKTGMKFIKSQTRYGQPRYWYSIQI